MNQKKRQVHGDDHSSTITTINNLVRDLPQIWPDFRRNTAARRSASPQPHVRGANHPNTLLGITNLAAAYERTKDFAKAEPLCREALEGNQTCFGRMHASNCERPWRRWGKI